MTRKLYGTTFCGNEASDYAKENGYLDYRTFSKAFEGVLNNTIFEQGWSIGYGWEQENGNIDNTDEIEDLEEKIADLEDTIETEREALDELDDLYENETNFDKKNAIAEQRTIVSNGIEEFENEIGSIQEKIDDLQNEMD